MKKLLASAAVCLFSLVPVRADLTVEQKMESPFLNGSTVMKIKGDQARMDVPGPAGQTTLLMDLKSGEMTTLIHAQKIMVKMNMLDAKKAADAQAKATGLDVTKLKPTSMGAKEKVGEWDCEVFQVQISNGMSVKLWIAKNYPNYKAIMEQMQKINSFSASGMGMDPNAFDLGGMAVKSEVTVPQGKIVSTLVSVKEEAVADSEFATPTGYKEIKMPRAPTAK